MNKKIFYIALASVFVLSTIFLVKSQNAFKEKIYYTFFPMTKEQYSLKLKSNEQELARIMSVGYYSKNKVESLKKLKFALYELKKNGAKYEND